MSRRHALGRACFLAACVAALLACRGPSGECRAAVFTDFSDDVLAAVGDSLTHGTMNATNNEINTRNGWLQQVHASLATVGEIACVQPFLDTNELRIDPFSIPTNLAVDGADIFSADGRAYWKRNNTYFSLPRDAYYCNHVLPAMARDLRDSVLYPINVLARRPVTQVDATVWLLSELAGREGDGRVVFVFWLGNNDSAGATLGTGGAGPTFLPLPLDLVGPRLGPAADAVLAAAEHQGWLSLEPYTMDNITRNLTDAQDFSRQYARVVDRIVDGVPHLRERVDMFLCTLPYYSSIGYLLDSDDLEYYLRKVAPDYTLPATFARSGSGSGQEEAALLQGDRVSLFTFLSMYVLLHDGVPVADVNRALERDGVQRDGLVLSEAEQALIQARIDSFNDAIRETAARAPGAVHLADVGPYMNEILSGRQDMAVSGTTFSRAWGRGGIFSLDGVHPGYTAQAAVANRILEEINAMRGMDAPLRDLQEICAGDPYVDRDGDGWVPGPGYEAPGIPALLMLFTDPDDADPEAGPLLPDDIWERVAEIVMQEYVL